MSVLSSSMCATVQGSNVTTTVIHGNYLGPIPGVQNFPDPYSPLPDPVQEQSTFSPQASNEIYSRLLMPQKRGTPLWIPEPNELLPISYRREGFSIGDVGFLTDFGGFSFLFNIYRPRDDPINPPVMPENFVPLPPLSPRMDLSQNHDLKPNTCIASSSVVKLQNDTPGALSFRTSSSDSAILVIPDGAISQDLLKAGSVDKYIEENLESWYRYTIGDRGHKLENGDIRVVTGWDKAMSWGMATTQQQVSELTFGKAIVSPECNSGNSGSLQYSDAYIWDYSGMATVKTGPDQREIEALKVDDRPDQRYQNQCVFVRVKSAKLRDGTWATLISELGLVQVDSNPTSATQPGPDKARFQEDSETTALEERETPTDSSTRLCPIPSSPAAITYHPSDAINSTLLELCPAAKVAITSDQDWCSVLTEDNQTLPDPVELWRRIESRRSIAQENGLVFLKLRPLFSPKSAFYRQALLSPIDWDAAGVVRPLSTYCRPVSSQTQGTPLDPAMESIFKVAEAAVAAQNAEKLAASKLAQSNPPLKPTFVNSSSATTQTNVNSHSPQTVPRKAIMGVRKETLKEGDGETRPVTGNVVELRYTGYRFENRELVEFSNSETQYRMPFRVEIGTGKVIKGWDEGIKTMYLGETARLTIPPDRGYGALGYHPIIPPHSTLVYEIELLKIETGSGIARGASRVKCRL